MSSLAVSAETGAGAQPWLSSPIVGWTDLVDSKAEEDSLAFGTCNNAVSVKNFLS